MIAGFTLQPVHGRAALAEARRLREEVYRERLGLDTSAWELEDARDREGYVFLLRHDGALVGTGRAVRTSSPLCELRALGRLPGHLEHATDACEVGRIATAQRSEGVPTSAVILCLGARWLLANTDVRRYAAYAREPVLGLYEQVGAVDDGSRFTIPGRGEAVYGVVSGTLADAAAVADRVEAALAGRATSEAGERR